jgi:MHS family proline/betaine transporter-like MFS transporter
LTKKTFAISFLTVFVQYYDYHLFGFLAANIAVHFFPDADIVIQLLNAYFLMAIAMVAKPLGAIIFGRIGDVVGRSNSLILSLYGTSFASFVLFATPSNESIGLLSAFILLLCRMVVCALVSSGTDGVRIYVFEHIGQAKQSFGLGVTTLFTLLGSLGASMSAAAFTSGYLPDYSWKFAFLIGTLLGLLVILVMRMSDFKDGVKVKSHPKFKEFKDHSITAIIKSNKKLFALCVLLAGGIGSTNQFILIFFGTYNFKLLGIAAQSQMQNYISISIGLYMAFSVISGIIADRIGKYKVTVMASVIILLITLGQCYYLSKLELKPILLFLTSTTLPFITIPGAAILTQSIPSVIRYRLFSFSHAVGSIIISSPTAFISTFLYHKTNISWIPLCYFITTILVISFALYKLKARIHTKYDDQNSFQQYH